MCRNYVLETDIGKVLRLGPVTLAALQALGRNTPLNDGFNINHRGRSENIQ